MKKWFLLTIFTILITSCGSDGKDGKAYLSFTWDWYVDSYWDDNPDIPSTFEAEVDYQVQPGTYEYEYYCSDGADDYWYWDGTYRIEINEGESGRLFSAGKDGDDNYFILNLDGLDGASFNAKLIYANIETKESLTTPTIDLMLYNKIPIGLPVRTEQYSSHGRMIIEGQWYKLEKK